MNTRYFLVYYESTCGSKGYLDITVGNGRSFSRKFIANEASKKFNLTGEVLVTGWDEFKSKQDYLDFYDEN